MSDRLCFRSIRGADRSAHDLHTALTAGGIEITLTACREQMARRLGHTNWHALTRTGVPPGEDDSASDRRSMVAAMAEAIFADRRRNPIALMNAEQIVDHIDGTVVPVAGTAKAWRDRALLSLYDLARAMVWRRDHRGLDLDLVSLRRAFSVETMTRMALPAAIAAPPWRDMPADIRAGLARNLICIPGYPSALRDLVMSDRPDSDHPLARNPLTPIRLPLSTTSHHDVYLKQVLGNLTGTGNRKVNAWLAGADLETVMRAFDRHAPTAFSPEDTFWLVKLATGMAAVVSALIWLRDHRARPLTLSSIANHLRLHGLARLATLKDLAPPRYRALPALLRKTVDNVLRNRPGMLSLPLQGGWMDTPFSWPEIDLTDAGLRLEQSNESAIADILGRIANDIDPHDSPMRSAPVTPPAESRMTTV